MSSVAMWTWIIGFQILLAILVVYLDYKKWLAYKELPLPSEVKLPYFKTFWRTYLMIFLFVVDCWGYGFSKGIESVI
jgi:hypothetical protein